MKEMIGVSKPTEITSEIPWLVERWYRSQPKLLFRCLDDHVHEDSLIPQELASDHFLNALIKTCRRFFL